METVNFINLSFCGTDSKSEERLKVNQKRLESFLQQASEQGFIPQRWEGEYVQKNPKEGINRSHRKIVLWAKENNLERVFIAEDDLIATCPTSWQYFLECLNSCPSYDCFFAITYTCNKQDGNRILGDFSGGTSLWCCHNRFYDTFINLSSGDTKQPDNYHVDRRLGSISKDYEMYVCPEIPFIQSGGFSNNLNRFMEYSNYLIGKKIYGRTEHIYKDGIWSI